MSTAIKTSLIGDAYAASLTMDDIKTIGDEKACIAVARCDGYWMEYREEEYIIPQSRYSPGRPVAHAQRTAWHISSNNQSVSLHNLMVAHHASGYTEEEAWQVALKELIIHDPIIYAREAFNLLQRLIDEGFNVDISNDCGKYRVMPYGCVPINEAVEIMADDLNTAIVRAWLMFRHFKAIGWIPE